MSEKILVVDSIKKNYGKSTVLKSASFECEKGKCIGIVGVNGSGKSTLLSIIAGIQKADGGSVLIDGTDISKDSGCIGENVGYVPQSNPLIEDLTVKDNLQLWYCDGPYNLKEELATGFLKTLEIDKYVNKTVKKLSGGMKKRVSIAIAVHNKPSLLLLDEPSAALDLIAKKAIRDYLKKYISEGGTVVIVTHDEEELDLCDEIYVVSDGKLKKIPVTLRGEQLLKEISL